MVEVSTESRSSAKPVRSIERRASVLALHVPLSTLAVVTARTPLAMVPHHRQVDVNGVSESAAVSMLIPEIGTETVSSAQPLWRLASKTCVALLAGPVRASATHSRALGGDARSGLDVLSVAVGAVPHWLSLPSQSFCTGR